MNRDISYIIIIVWLLTIMLTANTKLKKIDYEKGYNDRQAEIMDAIKEADKWCSDSIERGNGTTGYVIDSKITLVDFTLKENRFNERIIYKCKRAYGTETGSLYPKFGWSADPIWIGNNRCECIEFSK